MSQLTKKAIQNALVSLLNQYPLDKITVKDIVEECGITRNTFYYYYHDVYDLLQDIFNTQASEVLKMDAVTEEGWILNFKSAMSFALENRRAIYHVYNSFSRDELEKYLYTVVGDRMEKVIKRIASERVPEAKDDDIAMITQVFKYSLVGIVFDWLEDGMKQDLEKKMDRFSVIAGGEIERMLKKGAEIPDH